MYYFVQIEYLFDINQKCTCNIKNKGINIVCTRTMCYICICIRENTTFHRLVV